jgi:prepilin-type N-terminal cleavage/methylation domain-containing protein
MPTSSDRRPTTAGCGRSDAGFSLIELSMTMALVVIVGLLASVTLLGTKGVVDSVSWRAEANSEIRQLIDQSFADIAAARPLAQCEESNLDGTCAKITESRIDATDASSGVPSVLVSARPDRVCYRTQRRDPVTSRDASVTPAAWKACLGVDPNGQLVLTATPPSASSTYATTTAFDEGLVRRRVLGTVDTAGSRIYFTFFDLSGRALDVTDLPDADSLGNLLDEGDTPALVGIAKVQLQIRLSYYVGDSRLRTRALTYTAALRSSRYEQERWWSGDKGTG